MKNTIKGTLILIGMVTILGLGMDYLIINDPTNEQRAVFTLVFKEFKQMAGELQKAFYKDEALPPSQKSVTKYYQNKTGEKVAITLNIVVERDKMTIDFVDALGDQASVEFEPIVKVHKKSQSISVKWICSGGTMLLKFRSKPCRTLQGLSFESL